MNDILICKYKKCGKYLLDPILLNCSNNVCNSHVDELIDQTRDEFECFVCNKIHQLPNIGFLINKSFNEVILLNLHLNDKEKKAADILNKLKMNFNDLEKITNDPENFIFDYISDTRRKIDLERERLKNEIDSLSNFMLDQLKKFENECRQNLGNLEEAKKQCDTDLSAISSDISKWNELLRTPNTNKEEIDKLIEDASKLMSEIEKKLSDNKNTLLMNKECFFNAINTKFDQKLFGEFYVGDKFKSTILTPSQSFDLIKLCEFNPQAQFNLLYRATRDGFYADSFHEKCDGIPNTLAIIKVSGSSNIFGGFCSVTWDRSHKNKNDPNAFIFSLINNENFPLKINVASPTNAIFCSNSLGIIFGCGNGNDFLISNNSNANQESYSNLGSCYKSDLYPFQSTKAQNFLAGSYKFTTEEIEVYQVF